MNHVTSSGVEKTIATFKVRAPTKDGEMVGIVGNCTELKNWNHNQAILLTPDPELNALKEEMIWWTVDIELPTNLLVQYKYLIKTNSRLLKWEGFSENRKLLLEGFGMCVNDGDFGNLRGQKENIIIDQGWLADPNEIRLILIIENDDNKIQTPILSSKNGISRSTRPIKKRIQFYGMDSCKFQISVTPLSVMALSDEYLTNFHMKPKESGFVIIAHSPDHLSFSLEIRDEYSGISGKTIILASELQDDKGRLFRPIMNSSLIPIGEICIQYLIVKPFVHPSNNFSIIPSKKEELKFLIGHRGLGITKKEHSPSPSQNLSSQFIENTLLSFMVAARLGARYIEFDVQLSKDWIPIIVHDEEITIRTSTVNQSNVHIKVPVNKLNFKEITQLKALIVRENDACQSLSSSPVTYSRSIKRSSSEPLISEFEFKYETSPKPFIKVPEDFRPVWELLNTYPSLKQTFKHVSKEVGFNIEIKYPESEEMERYFAVAQRNIYVNTILQVIFDNAGDRKCIISSFDPDICYLVAAKQVRYPVFFLTEAGTTITDDYRKNSMEAAIQFAQSARLFGIVSECRPILNDLSLIAKCHQANLLIFTYGELNTNLENVKLQHDNGVDAIITDDIIHLNKYLTH